MKNRKFTRILALFTAVVTLALLMCACKKDDTDTPAVKNYDLTDFKIVREDGASFGLAGAVSDLKAAIEEKIGVSLDVSLDTETEIGEKEILIGETNRPESISTVAYIKKQNEKESWAIRIAPGKIIITGTDAASTQKAVEIFISDYVELSSRELGLDTSAGAQQLGIYDTDYITALENGTEISLDHVSAVIEKNKKYKDHLGGEFIPASGSYPSITELRYQENPENNGRLIAIFSMGVLIGPDSGHGTVMMSENQGKTWSCIARPIESLYPQLPSKASMAHIYELPAKVGDMPAGTLLYSYNSVDYDRNNNGLNGKSILAVWRSFDAGYTWEEYVVIDEAKGIKEGIWEPFMIYGEEDGYLYCFYSDDSDPAHDQKIVYKRSKDGVHWEGKGGKVGTGTGKDVEPVDVVAAPKASYRPGMPVITKMGNGEYFLVYEQFGDWSGCPIYYKTTKNLADWGDPSDIGTLIKTPNETVGTSSPSCAWIDAGGECGTLFVTSKSSTNKGKMFVSTDYGRTWETTSDPLKSDPIKSDQDRMGYSGGMWVGADGRTLYYINSDNSASDPMTQMIYVAKMTIYD